MNDNIAKLRRILDIPEDSKFAESVLRTITDLCEGLFLLGSSRTATLVERESPTSARMALDMFEPAGKLIITVRYNPETKQVVEVL